LVVFRINLAFLLSGRLVRAPHRWRAHSLIHLTILPRSSLSMRKFFFPGRVKFAMTVPFLDSL